MFDFLTNAETRVMVRQTDYWYVNCNKNIGFAIKQINSSLPAVPVSKGVCGHVRGSRRPHEAGGGGWGAPGSPTGQGHTEPRAWGRRNAPHQGTRDMIVVVMVLAFV